MVPEEALELECWDDLGNMREGTWQEFEITYIVEVSSGYAVSNIALSKFRYQQV